VNRADLFPLALALAFVLVAGLVSSLEVALSRVSRVRVEELVRESRRGAPQLQRLLTDPPRALNLLLLVRMSLELAAVGTVVAWSVDRLDGVLAVVLAVVVMVVVLYVLVGVGPRTIGRQQSERVALLGSGPVLLLTRLLGPVPTLLIVVGNAITAMARQPEAAGMVRTTMFLGIAFTEALALIGFVVFTLLKFA